MAKERKNPSVIIIGAGMTNLTLLEKGSSAGGTWRENTYPGVACDVPGHAYTYSFAPNPEWSSLFAPGREIHQYFIDVFHRYGIDDCTHFNQSVSRCAYKNDVWAVTTADGADYQADLLFAATGMLHQPVLPDIPGRDDFAGAAMHSAQWDHGVALAGKRIGVIGTGSSGAQLTPELVAMAGTEGIRNIEAEGIRTEDGQLHPLDVIVYATGFNPTAYMRPMDFIGRDGLSIDQIWQRKTQAYRSLCIPGFPNFFLMLGPNSPIGNYSVIAMSEQQANYALQLVDHWQNGVLDTIEAKPEAMKAWNTMLTSRMGHTVWSSGCQSWYLDTDGDPLTWPDTWQKWLAVMRTPELEDFVQPAAQSATNEAGPDLNNHGLLPGIS